MRRLGRECGGFVQAPLRLCVLLLFACTPPELDAPLPETCNGHAALCDRTFDAVVLAGTHNAMSNADDGWQIPNQPHPIRQQLEDGVRGLLIDTHEWEGEPYLCHGYCELGAAPLVEGLSVVREFLDANRGEVMTFIIEDGVSPEVTASAFAAADLDRLVYTWDGGGWPTLGEMVAANQRLVVTAESQGPPPEWYHHAWDLYVDTPYDFSSVSDFNCDVNRGSPDNPLFLLNHWVEDPFASEALSTEANAYDVLAGRAEACTAAFGRPPTLVAVDWYTAGDLFAVVDALNGV